MSTTDELFAKGIAAWSAHDYAGAEAAFLQVLEFEPYSSETMLNLGNAYFKQNKYEQAEDIWVKVVNINPMEEKVYLNLGNLFYKVKKYRKAIYYWEIFKKLNPIHDAINLNLGLAFEMNGQLVDAYRHYNLHLHSHAGPEGEQLRKRMDEAKKVALHNLEAAETLMKRGKLEKAKEAYLSCINMTPLHPKAYKHFATVLYQLNELEAAAEWFERTYRDMEHDIGTLINLGVVYEKLDDPLQALWAYTTAFKTNSKKVPPAVQKRCKQIWEAGGRGLLNQNYEKVKKLAQSRQYDEAEMLVKRLWDVAFLLDKDMVPEYKEKLGFLYDRKNPRKMAANIAFALGEDLREKGQFERAIHFYERYLELMPDGDKGPTALERKTEMEKTISSIVGAMLAPGEDALKLGSLGERQSA